MNPEILALGILFALASAVWVWSLGARDVSVADIFWPIYHVVLGIFFYAQSTTPSVFQSTALALIALWGLRLAYHLRRRQIGLGEDHRYTAIRNANGPNFPYTSLYLIFLPQAFMAWIICLILPPIFAQTAEVTWREWAGLLIATSGFVYEFVADLQLTKFRAQKSPTAILNTGLWRYSRHPNYFGEWLFWLGVCCISLHYSFWQPLLAMALLTFLLTRITGVKRMESTIGDRRPGYVDYVAHTSSFFPWKQLLTLALMFVIATPDVQASGTPTNQPETQTLVKTETWMFRAFIDKKEVGYHSFKAQYHPEGIMLEGEAKFEYKVMGITFFSYEHRVREEYDENFCLQKIASDTQIKDKSFSLVGSLTPRGFRVASEKKELHDTQCIVPFAYWAPTFIAQHTLLNGQTGELVPVSIYPENLTDSSTKTSYRVEADEMSLAVSYDADGKWIGLVSDLPAKRKLIYKLQSYKSQPVEFLASTR